MTERVFLSRRNLLTLLSKLDRNLLDPGASACTLIKSDTLHPVYPQTMDSIEVMAVEDHDYYIDRSPGIVHVDDDPSGVRHERNHH